MNVFIRVDSSIEIGTGHVMRCLTIAEELNQQGATVSFICRKFKGHLMDQIAQKGFSVYSLSTSGDFEKDKEIKHSHWLGGHWQTDASQTINILAKHPKVDWLIVDHYAIGEKWELEIRPYVKKIMVIDDLADRAHDCDLLLDQNYYHNFENRYEELVPENCLKLLGPNYALLRPEFREARELLKERDGEVRRILIFFGGSDPTNETTKALEAIKLLNRVDLMIDVVVGNTNPNKEQIKKMCSELKNCTFHCHIDYMADLMVKADLAIGAGGSTTWERCYLGLPTVTIITAENQQKVITKVEELGGIWNIGKSRGLRTKDISEKLEKIINSPTIVKEASHCAKRVMAEDLRHSFLFYSLLGDKIMSKLSNYDLIDLQEDDLELILNWRNSKKVRTCMYTDHKITLLEHKEWFKKVTREDSSLVKLLTYDTKPIGLVNFSEIDKKNNKCYWGFYIGEQNAPQGSGIILAILALELIFEKIGIRKLCAEILDINITSLKFHEKLGFKEEGRFVGHVVKNDQNIDMIPMALFSDKWVAVKEKLLLRLRRDL